LTLACASQHAAYYWIEINGRAVWRGDSFQDAEVLQRGFARRMAALGRGGARGA
jgi:hypothetical protein